MDSNLKALIVKKFKDSEMDLDVGRHWIDETVVVPLGSTSKALASLDRLAILIALRAQNLFQGVRS